MARFIRFHPEAYAEYLVWRKNDLDIFDRINHLILDITREPFKGIGKPEPLKGNYKGCWSRRITLEHRLIYRIDASDVIVLKCQGHYDD